MATQRHTHRDTHCCVHDTVVCMLLYLPMHTSLPRGCVHDTVVCMLLNLPMHISPTRGCVHTLLFAVMLLYLPMHTPPTHTPTHLSETIILLRCLCKIHGSLDLLAGEHIPSCPQSSSGKWQRHDAGNVELLMVCMCMSRAEMLVLEKKCPQSCDVLRQGHGDLGALQCLLLGFF